MRPGKRSASASEREYRGGGRYLRPVGIDEDLAFCEGAAAGPTVAKVKEALDQMTKEQRRLREAASAVSLHATVRPQPPLHTIFRSSGSAHGRPSTNVPQWQMPQPSQDRPQGAQSNLTVFGHASGGSPGVRSATARAAVGPVQAGQASGEGGVARIPLIRKEG